VLGPARRPGQRVCPTSGRTGPGASEPNLARPICRIRRGSDLTGLSTWGATVTWKPWLPRLRSLPRPAATFGCWPAPRSSIGA